MKKTDDTRSLVNSLSGISEIQEEAFRMLTAFMQANVDFRKEVDKTLQLLRTIRPVHTQSPAYSLIRGHRPDFDFKVKEYEQFLEECDDTCDKFDDILIWLRELVLSPEAGSDR